MARSQQPDGRIKPIPMGAWSVAGAIRTNNPLNGELDDLARNCNTIWARRTPALVSQQTPGMVDATTFHPRRFRIWETGAFGAIPQRFVWRPHVAGFGARDLVGGRLLIDVPAATEVEVRLTSINGGGITTTTITPTGGTVWVDLGPVQVLPDGIGSEIVALTPRLSLGSGNVYVYAAELYVEQEIAALPAGVDATGFEALDTIQFEGDSAFAANLRVLGGNNEILFKRFCPQVLCHSVDYLSRDLAVGAKTARWYQDNPYSRDMTKHQWATLLSFNYYPREGEEITELGYSMCVCRVTADDADLTSTVYSSLWRDGSPVAVHNSPDAVSIEQPDPLLSGEWVDGTISVGSDPTEPVWIRVVHQVAVVSMPAYGGIYSVSFWPVGR